jgi:hypothetical protein
MGASVHTRRTGGWARAGLHCLARRARLTHWPNKNHVPAHMTKRTSSPRSRSSRSSSRGFMEVLFYHVGRPVSCAGCHPPTSSPATPPSHPLTFFHASYLAGALLIQARELNEAVVSYRFGRGDGLAAACPRGGIRLVRPQEALRSTPCSGQEASGTRHGATRSTGSATNARPEPRHAQPPNGSRG